MKLWDCQYCGKQIAERTNRVRKFCSKACDAKHDRSTAQRSAYASPLRTMHADRVLCWMALARERA
jgi:hypothetical protein